MYLFHEVSYWGGQLWNQGAVLGDKGSVLEDGRSARLHLQAVLQLEGLEAHQQAHGDGAQGHQQAQGDGQTGQPVLDRGLARGLPFRGRVAGCIHGELLGEGTSGAPERGHNADYGTLGSGFRAES